MDKPTGYIVRPKDMKALVRKLNRPQTSLSELYEVARTLIGWAEPQQTQLPPVSVASLALPLNEPVMRAYADADAAQVKALRSALAQWGVPLDEPVNVPADPDVDPQPYDMPSPEADALDRIADTVRVGDLWSWGERLDEIAAILRETGRVL